MILRRTFLDSGSPQTEDQRWYIIQNWRQDPVVTVTDGGVQVERAVFSPYGRVFGMPAGDVDFTGTVTYSDEQVMSGWEDPPLSLAYKAYADVDLDGDVDGGDAAAANGTAMGHGVLSSVGSTVGYAGYTRDAYVPSVYHVRHRVYKSDLGRWVQRDPAGYADGVSLYQYVMSRPAVFVDPLGLASGGSMGMIDHPGGGRPAAEPCGPGVPGGGSPQPAPPAPGTFQWIIDLIDCLDKCENAHQPDIDHFTDTIFNIMLAEVKQGCRDADESTLAGIVTNAPNSPAYGAAPEFSVPRGGRSADSGSSGRLSDALADIASQRARNVLLGSVRKAAEEGITDSLSRLATGITLPTTSGSYSLARLRIRIVAYRGLRRSFMAASIVEGVGRTSYQTYRGEYWDAGGTASRVGGSIALGSAAGMKFGGATGALIGFAAGAGYGAGAEIGHAVADARLAVVRANARSEDNEWECQHLNASLLHYESELGNAQNDLEECQDSCFGG